jgi:hypothetical protein
MPGTRAQPLAHVRMGQREMLRLSLRCPRSRTALHPVAPWSAADPCPRCGDEIVRLREQVGTRRWHREHVRAVAQRARQVERVAANAPGRKKVDAGKPGSVRRPPVWFRDRSAIQASPCITAAVLGMVGLAKP